MASPTYRFLLSVVLMICLPLSVHGNEDLGYETIRFYTNNSKPEQLGAHALSPDGRYLALSFRRNTGSKSGVSIVDLNRLELVKQTGSYSFFELAFSSDSRRVLGIGNYAGIQLVDVATGSIQRPGNLPKAIGKIGININEKNGKLLISNISHESNPTIGDQIQVGDELLAINKGERPVRYSDRREWKTLAGKPLKKALEILSGWPGSWVQLRLARRGKADPIDASVQRQWQASYDRTMPARSQSLLLGINKGVFQFRSADTVRFCAFISVRDIERTGQFVPSPDGQRFGALAAVVDVGGFCLEVHDLQSGTLEQSTMLPANNFRHMRFSPDSKRALVGTRDTIEIFDVESADWQDPVVLTPPEDVDIGRVVTRRIPLGLGFPGDLYTTAREVVYAKPAALKQFAVSPNGTLAVGSETGEIVLAEPRHQGASRIGGRWDSWCRARDDRVLSHRQSSGRLCSGRAAHFQVGRSPVELRCRGWRGTAGRGDGWRVVSRPTRCRYVTFPAGCDMGSPESRSLSLRAELRCKTASRR